MSDPSTTLGPAEVTRAGREPEVRLQDGRVVQVRTAFTFPYVPAVGDTLLVIGAAEATEHYAVGVLSGGADSKLEFQGDVDVRAVGGVLSLRGEQVEIETPKLTLRANQLRTFAESITEKTETAVRWVKGLLTERAGESRRVVQGEDFTQSKTSTTLAEGVLKIDGHEVHLGR